MKLIATLFCILITTFSFSQSKIQKELDSIKTVHQVCVIKDDLIKQRLVADSLNIESKKLNNQLNDIKSFKIGRTSLDKEKQLKEINSLILSNKEKHENSITKLKKLVSDLKTAKLNVKELSQSKN